MYSYWSDTQKHVTLCFVMIENDTVLTRSKHSVYKWSTFLSESTQCRNTIAILTVRSWSSKNHTTLQTSIQNAQNVTLTSWKTWLVSSSAKIQLYRNTNGHLRHRLPKFVSWTPPYQFVPQMALHKTTSLSYVPNRCQHRHVKNSMDRALAQYVITQRVCASLDYKLYYE